MLKKMKFGCAISQQPRSTDRQTAMHTQSKRCFDTINTITCNARPLDIERAFDRCDRYERKLSRFVKNSDVWRINHAHGKPVRIGSETQTILQCADEMKSASFGAFNVAIGTVSRLWNFNAPDPEIPSRERIATALASVQQAELTVEDGFAIASPGTMIDLGGIAKGYICGKIADYLTERGATSGILNFGGNIVTIGNHPDGRPWKIGLQSPNAQRESAIFASVYSANSSVVTSGAYERCFVKEGTLYHHILDPRTCEPAATNIASVSIVAADPMLADALATAVFILGNAEGFALIRRYKAEAAILQADGRLCHTAGLRLQAITNPGKPAVAIPLVQYEITNEGQQPRLF